jgi:hypothetical protein
LDDGPVRQFGLIHVDQLAARTQRGQSPALPTRTLS